MTVLLAAGKRAISVVLDHLRFALEAQCAKRLVYLCYAT